MNKLLACYLNGNYRVKLFEDGTKVKETTEDCFRASFPDSIDLKITNYCDLNCPMCHELSSSSGKEGNLNSEFLNSLKKGTELAVGGGNPLSHKDLLSFLKRMKDKGIICNLTVNEKHLLKNMNLLQELIDNKLIYGLGVSLNVVNDEVVEFAKRNNNVVFHVINGLFTDFDKIINRGLKVLILGYKMFGRGKAFYSEEIKIKMDEMSANIVNLFDKFECISFDNLALGQLKIRDLVSEEEWESMYMGDDGEASMYIDLVEEKFARSSTSIERYELEDDIITMFNKVKVVN